MCSTSPCMIRSKPSSTPYTSTPSSTARIVAAPITALMPGAGPPPTRIASLRGCVISRFRGSRRDCSGRGGAGQVRRQNLLLELALFLLPELDAAAERLGLRGRHFLAGDHRVDRVLQPALLHRALIAGVV